MPPKGSSRRSTRGAKPSAPDSSSSVLGAHGAANAAAFKDDTEPVKPRRGAKARTTSYQLDEPKASARASKAGQHAFSIAASTPAQADTS